MSKLETIDHQIKRLLDAFVGAKEEALKLAVVENGLAFLETRLWLADFKEAAIFCVELERLRAYLVSDSSPDAFKLFSINLKRLSEFGTERFNSALLGAVNDMRAVRGAMGFERATTLIQVERTLWREMHRRTNVSRRLRRHTHTVIDLLDASEDSSQLERALPMLGREAEALKTLFRFNPSNLVWVSLHSLCVLAHAARSTISLRVLRKYCASLNKLSEEAKSIQAAWPCVVEIATQIERFDAEHPLLGLLKSSTDETALDLRAPEEQDAQASGRPGLLEAGSAPRDLESRAALAPEISSSETVDDLPVEAKSLADAVQNLSGQIAAGLIEETVLLEDMQTLAAKVLNRAAEEGGDVGRHVGLLEHLCELIDLAASGVTLPESEFASLATELGEYVSGAKALKQIDEALTALQTLRDRIAIRRGTRSETNPEEQEIEDLLARIRRIQEVDREDEEDSDTRLFGYWLVRGGQSYALRHREDMRIESAGALVKERPGEECEQRSIEDLFPQTVSLATPKQRLSFSEAGRCLGLACDEVRGPSWIELLRPLNGGYGFAQLADGENLCILSPEMLLSHCR